MSVNRADLFTHSVRSRILTALMGRELTIGQLARLLPDVPLPSLYRHTRILTEAGILEALREIRVKGALTKVYAVNRKQAVLKPDEIGDLEAAEHLRHFTTFLTALSESFRGYLEQSPLDPEKAPLHALMRNLTLSFDEYRQFLDELGAFLARWQDRPMEGDRQRLIFAHIAIPDRPDPPLA